MNRLSLASSLMILGGITGLFASAQSSPNGLIQVNLINDSTLAVSNGIGNQRVTLMNIECGEVATVKTKEKQGQIRNGHRQASPLLKFVFDG